MLCTQWKSPALRPLRPNVPTTSPVSRTSVRTSLLVASALNRKLCLPSIQKSRSQTEPADLLVGELLQEAAVLAEHLDAVVGAVADVDEAIPRDLDAMNPGYRIAMRSDCR